MGKVKEQLLEDLEFQFQNEFDDGYQYKEWLKSKEFVEYVNGEIDSTRPRYSEYDIMSATRYASEHITIPPSEVGKEVYDMLFSEKIEEYLTCKTDIWTTKNT
tara:strand:+ start:213 stop:521 length:309 start_codon:yes stop_codon:yes gene_type:complete